MTKFTIPLGKSHLPDDGFEMKMKIRIKLRNYIHYKLTIHVEKNQAY